MNANEYQGFRVYLNDTPVDTFYIYESARYFVKTIDLANYRIDEGWHVFKVKAITRGGEFPIGNDSGIQFYCSGHSSNKAQPFTYINIDKFDNLNNEYCAVTFTVNGYGTVDVSSMTKNNLYRAIGEYNKVGVLHSVEIKYYDSDLIQNGTATRTAFIFSEFKKNQLGSFPLGTVEVHAHSDNCSKYVYFYSMSELDFKIYDGTYPTEITPSYNATGLYGFNVAVTKLSTVHDDWMTLVNLFCYLRSAVKGELDFSLFSSYIPKKGEVIQAWMYNALREAAIDCAYEVGIYTNFRDRVSSGDTIPKDFIQTLGEVANACIEKKMSENRAKLGRH